MQSFWAQGSTGLKTGFRIECRKREGGAMAKAEAVTLRVGA